MANPHRRDNRPAEKVKSDLVNLLRQGSNIADGLKIVGRSRSWYEEQRRKDKDFAALVDKVRGMVNSPDMREQDAGEFEEFAEKYLGIRVWPHQRNMIDLLEGREPSWLHPSMQYSRGSAGHTRILVNVPPNHAKTMTVSISYATYRMIKDPTLSIMIISKTQDMAKKILYGIKQRLTHPRYADLQLAFAPVDGWKADADQWSATRIYLGGDSRDTGDKDPNAEALGMGGQVYGARAGLIIVDDAVTLANASEWPKQMEWIRQEVGTRLGPGGQLLVVGTRVASTDLYSELLNEEHYTDGLVPWTSLVMPAVLEYAESEEDWRTLWPWSEMPFTDADEPNEDGDYPRWTGSRLARVRNEVGPRKWSLVYQNVGVEEDSTFDPVCVQGSVDGMRKAGPLNPELKGHPERVEGFYRICSMDPAIAGNTAAVAYAVDKATGNRYVLDVKVMTGPTPAMIRDLIYDMTEMYKPHEWIIETNAFQGFLVYDEELNRFLANKGITLKPHYTGSNKQDPDFGVASMAPLFGSVATVQTIRRHQGDNLISLPSTQSYGVKMLVEELIAWSPLVKTKNRRQDTVMALWFAETRAREVIQTVSKRNFFAKASGFTSQRDLDRRYVVNLDDVQQQNQAAWI